MLQRGAAHASMQCVRECDARHLRLQVGRSPPWRRPSSHPECLSLSHYSCSANEIVKSCWRRLSGARCVCVRRTSGNYLEMPMARSRRLQPPQR